MLKFYVKVFYVMGKALTGELSCPCDRFVAYVPKGCFRSKNSKYSFFYVLQITDEVGVTDRTWGSDLNT